MPSLICKTAKQLAEQAMKAKEITILNSIIYKIGTCFTFQDIVDRGKFKINHEGVELFYFDGEALIEFQPFKTEIDGFVIRAGQHYRLLYK